MRNGGVAVEETTNSMTAVVAIGLVAERFDNIADVVANFTNFHARTN